VHVQDERAGEGVEHLQAAAKELIEAARSFLDVAEDLVRDPSVAEGLLAGIGDLADTARHAARDAARRAAGADGGGDDEGEDDGGVEHIHVS
jgi:hypothetical protein